MTHSFPKIIYIFDRYKKASSKHKGIIEMRITYNRKQKYISTGIQLYPKQWRNSRVINTPDAQQLNQHLDKMLIDVRQILIDMEECIDIFAIANKLDKKRKGLVSLYEFIRQRAEIRTYGKSKNTLNRYERFIRLFKQWNGIKTFEDITEANIIAYDKYLASTGMKNYSKWQNYHRFLNSFILDAIEAGLLKRNPYKWVNIATDRTPHTLSKCLTPEEFQRIKAVKLPTACLEKIRDAFVFQTYTCLAYTDLKNFDANKIVYIKKMPVYTGKRDKTGKTFTIPLLKPAMVILNKYKNKLPVISNVKYNQYLKLVAQAAGIDKPVSTHYARHTGATLLLNKGVDMKIISKICGHSSVKITEQVYAKLLDETVVDAIKKLTSKSPHTCFLAYSRMDYSPTHLPL